MTHPDDEPRLDDLLRAAARGAAPLTDGPAATRARVQRHQRRSRLVGGALALVLVAAGGGAALALPDGSERIVADDPSPTAAPTPSASPAPSSAPPPSLAPSPGPSPAPSSPPPSPTPSPAAARLQLSGDDLGVTRVGASKEQAVAAVSEVLGRADDRPSSCIGGVTEVQWDDLLLAFDQDGLVNGWVVTTPRLTTPAGVRVGTTVAQLRETYGERLTIYPANPDGPESYEVDGVDMLGVLTGAGGDDRVTSLRNGACTGP